MKMAFCTKRNLSNICLSETLWPLKQLWNLCMTTASVRKGQIIAKPLSKFTSVIGITKLRLPNFDNDFYYIIFDENKSVI